MLVLIIADILMAVLNACFGTQCLVYGTAYYRVSIIPHTPTQTHTHTHTMGGGTGLADLVTAGPMFAVWCLKSQQM